MGTSSRTKKTQIGREATAGTAVAATSIWPGPCVKLDPRDVVIVDEATGQYMNRGETYIADLGVQGLTMEAHPATFETLLHVLEAGIDTVAAAGADPYTYAYTLPAAASDVAIKAYTIETGDSVQAEEMAYCFVPSFELKGGANGVLELSANWQGRQWASSTFTAALQLPSVEHILFNTGSLYIDDSGGSVGGTQVASAFAEFTLSVNTGLVALQTGDGQLYFTATKRVKPSFSLSLTAEHVAAFNSAGEVTDFRAGSIRLVRCSFPGSDSRSLVIDAAAIWQDFSWGDRDGNSVISGTLEGIISSADSSLALIMTIINHLAAVP